MQHHQFNRFHVEDQVANKGLQGPVEFFAEEREARTWFINLQTNESMKFE